MLKNLKKLDFFLPTSLKSQNDLEPNSKFVETENELAF